MFEYNAYSAPLLPGFLQGVIFAVVLFLRARREERISDVFGGLLLIAGALYVAQWMLGFAGWYDAHDWRTTLMFYVPWKNLLAFGPLIWLYFRSLTNTDFRWRRGYVWHFLPLGLVLLQPLAIFLYDFGIHLLLKGASFADFHGTRGPAAEWDNTYTSVVFDVIYALSVVHLLVYLMRTLRDYRAYRAYVVREFSNAEQLTFASLRLTLYLMLAGSVATVMLDVGNQFFSETYADSWDSFFVMSVFVYCVAIQFYSLNPALTRALRFEPDAEPNSLDSLVMPSAAGSLSDATNQTAQAPPDPELERYAQKLEQRLSTQQDYLNPELKLADLAAALGTNSSVLSRVINTHYGQNFNDFVNARRCAAFQARLVDGEHLRHTLLSLALDCGFNSKSTFNRAFKKATGMSPGAAVKALDGT